MVDETADRGISGLTLDRPGLAGVRQLAADGDIRVVVLRSVDRASRSLTKVMALEEELREHNVRIISLDSVWAGSDNVSQAASSVRHSLC